MSEITIIDCMADELYEHEVELLEMLGSEDEDELRECVLYPFESDPDILRYKGEDILFYDIDNLDHKYIIYADFGYVLEDEDKKVVIQLLTDFYDDDDVLLDKFQRSEFRTWEVFRRDDKTRIAYRGGSGYTYQIWETKGVNNDS